MFDDILTGFESGVTAFIFNLLWATIAPILILLAPDESKLITAFLVSIFTVAFIVVDVKYFASASIGTIIGYGIAIWAVAQYDVTLSTEMAIPLVLIALITMPKVINSRNGR